MAKVVLIDDEARLLATFARFLERQGLEVVRAASFAEADEHLQSGRFEVLVSDIVMPAFDCMRVLPEVVSVRQCQEPVILITGILSSLRVSLSSSHSTMSIASAMVPSSILNGFAVITSLVITPLDSPPDLITLLLGSPWISSAGLLPVFAGVGVPLITLLALESSS